MRINFFIRYLLVAGFILQGCQRTGDNEEQRLSWSTDSPMSIPYRTRLQRLERQNLIRNHSFETGRTFKLNDTVTSYAIDGWHQVGPHVEWVDTRVDSLFKKDDSFSGNRAVKITRKQAYETDAPGEGVLSEFIKIIPGNYSFSFFTRLEGVAPGRARLGTRLYDGVEVRLYFFDKNKNPLSGIQSFPHLNQQVDNTFKALSFANYKNIDAFPWGRVIGKSAVFPYPEGDVPSDAHYVKIFIGLKGTGIMWIDNVDFRYTGKNFSVAERMKQYTDTGFITKRVIIPAPKIMESMASVNFTDKRYSPAIIVPSDAGEITLQAAGLIRNALSMAMTATGVIVNESEPAIIRNQSLNLDPDTGLIFSIGKTDLYNRFSHLLPVAQIAGHSQGYFIYSVPDYPNLVFLDGNSDAGVYYAALTSLQLFDGMKPVFHNARIIDYPDFEKRCYAIPEIKTEGEARRQELMANSLIQYKMNGAFYTLFSDSSRSEANWPRLSMPSHELFSPLLVVVGNGNLPPADKIGQTPFVGVTRIPELIQPDDSTLSYTYPVNFQRAYDTDYGSNGPGSRVSPGLPATCSFIFHPVFSNQLLDYSSYTDIVLPNPGIPFLYSGSSFFSMNTDDADIFRFTRFSGNKPMWMDNSMLISTVWGRYGGNYPYYPGKARLYNIFEPFLNTGISNHLDKIDRSMFYLNFSPLGEIDIIRTATAADYMWNTRDYNPELSLWRVLFSRYGRESAQMLVNYADQYSLILEFLLKVERNEQASRNLKNAQTIFGELVALSNNIEKKLGPRHPLMADLYLLNKQLKKKADGFMVSISKSQKDL